MSRSATTIARLLALLALAFVLTWTLGRVFDSLLENVAYQSEGDLSTLRPGGRWLVENLVNTGHGANRSLTKMLLFPWVALGGAILSALRFPRDELVQRAMIAFTFYGLMTALQCAVFGNALMGVPADGVPVHAAPATLSMRGVDLVLGLICAVSAVRILRAVCRKPRPCST